MAVVGVCGSWVGEAWPAVALGRAEVDLAIIGREVVLASGSAVDVDGAEDTTASFQTGC